jgi:hypothetical protein
MQSVEEFMRQCFEAQIAQEKREIASRARFLRRFYTDDRYLGDRPFRLQSLQSQKVLSISSSDTNAEVVTRRELPGAPECTYDTRYRLQASSEGWRICGVDLQCCPCEGEPGKYNCPRCHGTGWMDTKLALTGASDFHVACDRKSGDDTRVT